MNQKLMVVVVKYDLHPHMLVFDVARIGPTGKVYVKDVGTYHSSSVVAVVPKKEGELIAARLKVIEAEIKANYSKACAAAKESLFKEFPALRRAK
jgi:hypothetical protein